MVKNESRRDAVHFPDIDADNFTTARCHILILRQTRRLSEAYDVHKQIHATPKKRQARAKVINFQPGGAA